MTKKPLYLLYLILEVERIDFRKFLFMDDHLINKPELLLIMDPAARARRIRSLSSYITSNNDQAGSWGLLGALDLSIFFFQNLIKFGRKTKINHAL